MRLITVDSYEGLSETAASLVAVHVASTPDLSLTLPTGNTPLGLYRILRTAHAERRFSLAVATVFMLDEYLDLPDYPKDSFIEYLREHLADVIFNDTTSVRAMIPSDGEPLARAYDAAIDEVGAIDLAIVGVGRNGHVGFNEPGSRVDQRTHVAPLSASTLDANFAARPSKQRPTKALTIGLADLLGARNVLMLVSGSEKADVAARLRAGVVDPSVPATQLLAHDDLTIVMDVGALGDSVVVGDEPDGIGRGARTKSKDESLG